MESVSVSVTKLTRMNTKAFKDLKNVLLVNDPWGKEMVVVIPHEYYKWMQEIVLWAQAREIDKEMNNA